MQKKNIRILSMQLCKPRLTAVVQNNKSYNSFCW